MPQNFRVPSGSQAGGNPKKKRRTSQNTATPVSNSAGGPGDMGPPNMMGGPPGPGDTMYAANPFDDTPNMSPGAMGNMAPAPGMSPNSMGSNGPGMGQGSPNMAGGGPGTPNSMVPPSSMGMGPGMRPTGDMSMGGMDMVCPMDMYFHTGSGDCILFKDWKLHDGIGAVLDCVAIIVLGLLR